MSIQLSLPAAWRQNVSRCDPTEALAEISRDKADAAHAIELVLDRYAEKHGIGHQVLHKAVLGYVADMVSDLFFEKEDELRAELEAAIARECQ